MKTTIHIFTIYMFALSLIPCGDGGGGIVEIASHFFKIEHQHFSDHQQHSNDCGDDSCSPFCVCSCCSISINTPEKVAFIEEFKPPTPQNTPAHIPNFHPFNFNPTIWQPPII